MSNIININEFKDLADLQLYSESLFKALQDSNAKAKKLEDENQHLKTLLESVVPDLKPIPIEQLICELQIKKLHEAAMTRSLTLEETKRLDLLVKNLYLSKGQATEIIDNKNGPNADTAADEDLIKIIKGN